MSVVSDLLSNYQHVIDDLAIVMGTKGVFDVEAVSSDGSATMLYSKKETGRHAEPGDVLEAFRELVGPDVAVYGT